MTAYVWRSSARLTILVCLAGALGAAAEAQTLPAGWSAGDVGSPALHGTASFDAGGFSVSGAGNDIWGAADQFHFVYRQLTGDGAIVARVASVQAVDPWTKAGVMMRESLAAGSRHAFALVSASQGIAFQRRVSTGGSSTHTGASGAAPVWVRLERVGSSFTASRSTDGIRWTTIATQTITMPATIYVGLAVTSHKASQLAQATFTDVSVATSSLPEGWSSSDIGAATLAGSTTFDGHAFAIAGGGRDIWGSSDEFRFAYVQATGDLDVVARVESVEDVDPWTKAGVMIRGSLAPASAHASMFATPRKGMAFQWRPADGAGSEHAAGTYSRTPRWVKLSRRGSTVEAFESADGNAWVKVGSVTPALPATVYVGLAVTSHDPSALATATFSAVSVESATAPNEAPTVSLTAPASGATFTAPATVTVSASASDADGSVARVEFYAGTTLLGSDTTAPYTYTWNDVPPGSYSLTAVAVDNAGLKTTSAARSITVAAAPQPPTVSLTAPASGATFTAPATVTVSASASDADGSVARVEFYAGTTLLGSDSAAPYTYTWNDVPAGSYSLTAVAVDNAGLETTSAARSITVAAAPQPPTVSLTAPASGATFTAPAAVTLSASASDPDGSIVRVDFYAGTTLVASGTSAPYTYTWSNVLAGTYSITAVAVDNAGLKTTSAARTITVEPPAASPAGLVAHWQFDENGGTTAGDAVGQYHGTLQNGAAWAAGKLGAAVRFDGSNDYVALPNLDVAGSALTIATWVKSSAFPAGVDQRFVSKATDVSEQGHYWMVGQTNTGANRLRFRLKAGGTTATLIATSGDLPLDQWYHVAATYDGTAMRLYLNGVLVGSLAKTGALATGSAVAVNLGRNPDGAGYTHMSGLLDDVRIYDRALTAGEVAELANPGTPAQPNQPPVVSLSAPADGATYTAPAAMTVSASASDADGSVARVEFYAGATLLGSDTTAPYSIAWTDIAPGTYTVSARAWDDEGAWAASASRTITVNGSAPGNQSPSVSLTSPAAGATFEAPASIALAATASDPDGTVARVEFYAGSTMIGSDTTAPYTFSWTNVGAGSYSIVAVARDNAGATTVSSARNITVNAPLMPTTAVFVPSSNHATAVDRYVVEFFYAGADPTVSNPVAMVDIGKPAVVNGEVVADVSQTILTLTPGAYISTVTAIGAGGSAQSAPSPVFTR